jgi:hypothetical protein
LATESFTEGKAIPNTPEEIEGIINNLNKLFRPTPGASEQDPKTRRIESGKKITEAFELIFKLEKNSLELPDYFEKLKAAARSAENRMNSFEIFWQKKGMEFE